MYLFIQSLNVFQAFHILINKKAIFHVYVSLKIKEII